MRKVLFRGSLVSCLALIAAAGLDRSDAQRSNSRSW